MRNWRFKVRIGNYSGVVYGRTTVWEEVPGDSLVIPEPRQTVLKNGSYVKNE